MQITIIQARFLLAGYEVVVDFSQGFGQDLEWVRSELQRNWERIGSKAQPERLIGFWQPWQAAVPEPDSTSVAKGKYFFGVEVLDLDCVPSDCVVKAVPLSHYAVFRESRRGTAPKAEMYSLPGYAANHLVAGDFEVFDGFTGLGEDDPCDVLVPIRPLD